MFLQNVAVGLALVKLGHTAAAAWYIKLF
jgi:hypothetical protein